MRLWTNSGLAVKIALPQVIILGVSIFMIVSSGSALDRINATGSQIIETNVRKTVSLLHMESSLNESVIFVKSALLEKEDNKDALTRDADMFHKRRKEVESTADDVRASLADPKLKEDFAAITNDLNSYFAASEKIFDLKQSGNVEDAVALSNGDARALRGKLVGELRAIVDAYSAATEQDHKGALDLTQRTKAQQAVVSGVLILSAYLILGWVLIFQIKRPVTRVTDNLCRVAAGQLDFQAEATDRNDEVGKLIKALHVFKENALEKIRLEEEQKATAARMAEQRRKDMLQLADNFEASVKGIVDDLSSSADEMKRTADGLAMTATEVGSQSNSVAAAAEETSVNLQTVSAATEELSASVGEISRQVADSSTITSKAVDQAKSTNQTVKALAVASEKIGQVVGLIQSIAGQTNLLALNATIEAARAGDAGKGFAVVASEVKLLANQTSKATEDISEQISSMQQATGLVVDAIDGVGATITGINEITTRIAAAVEEQGAATGEISRNLQEATAGTSEVSSNVGNLSEAAQNTSTIAASVQSIASTVAERSTRLQEQVAKFLGGLRTA